MINESKNSVKSPDHTGQRLGNYQLISALEMDRNSRDYLAEHIQFKRKCLVKVWHEPLKAELVDSFLTQTRKLAQLVHPQILNLRDVGVEHLIPFVAMDYIPHDTLQQRISRDTPQPLSDILDCVTPVAEALQYAHNQGYIHKDIRPRNILLGRNHEVLLSNFIIDAVSQSEQQPNHMKAEEVTELLGYMAPEQMQGKNVPASDQYALAIVIYEWLSGNLPFRGSYGEIVNQHLHMQPPSLGKKVPALPQAVDEIIFTALSKDPQKRFPNILMFIKALQQTYGPVVATALPRSTRQGYPSPIAGPIKPFIGGPISAPAQVFPAQAAPAPVKAEPVALASPVPVQQAPVFHPQPAQAPISKQRAKSSPSTVNGKGKTTITRRAFVAGLVGAAAVGGGAAWLVLSQRVPLSSLAAGPSTSSTAPTTSSHPQASGGTLLVYRAHPARVNAVSWSPDGKRIASASDDSTVQICDAKTGATILTYRGHAAEVYTVSWSPDGNYIASGGADKTVQVWKATSGQHVITYSRHTGQINSLSWSSDSILVASGSDDTTVQVWNIANGDIAIIYSEHTAGVLSVAWSPDNTRIASGSWDNTVKTFSTIQTQSFAIGGTISNYRGHTAEVYSVAWSPDGSRIASAGGDKVVQVGNGINGVTLFTYAGHSDVVYSVAWSPDGKRLASADADNSAQIWSASSKQKITRQKLFTYLGHSNTVYAVAWAPDNKRLASGSADNTMRVWQPI